MKTTKDLKKLDNTNGHRVFVSNISGGRVLVSVVRGENARNKNQGDLVWQRQYNLWNMVFDSEVVEVAELIATKAQ